MAYIIQKMLENYQNKQGVQAFQAEKIHFQGVGGRDVYNITSPFEDEGILVIAGRVEGRDTEDSDVIFFVEENGVWKPRENTQTYKLQDPFFSWIHGQLVFGGVETFPHPTNEGALSWRTVFYKGDNIHGLKRFAVGPGGMKDIRLAELPNQKVGIFTRPQGEKGGRGKIGYTVIDTLDQLRPNLIKDAPLIKEHFIEGEWGGANEVHILKNGSIGVLGHIACFGQTGDRHYYPMTFLYDPEGNRITDMEIIAIRQEFPKGDAKRKDLHDVLFSGGLKRLDNGKAELYLGVSDAEAHKAIIQDPFIKYENANVI